VGWLSGFSYRKSHVINPASGAGTNYQVKITAHYGSGTDSGGDVYLNSHCRTDFGDVRFTGSDGVTLLSYWIQEKVDGDHATVWVKVADDLSTNAVTIYIYYGNATATTTSNGDNTFIFFDDFVGTSLDTSKWQANAGKGSITVANSEVRIYSAASTGVDPAIQALSGIDPLNKKFECKMRFASLPTGRQYGFNARSNSYYFFWLAMSPDTYDYYIAGTGSGYWEVVTWAANTNYICRSAHKSTGSVYERDSSSWTTTYTFASGTLLKILLGFYIYAYNDSTSNSVDMYIDWVFVRKWVDPEPSHGSWGVEEVYTLLLVGDGLTWAVRGF
jgi:hypothetical protein